MKGFNVDPSATPAAKEVNVTGEATIVQNATVEIGLKPEIVTLLHEAKMGLRGDMKMGRSMGGLNGAAPRATTGRVAGPN